MKQQETLLIESVTMRKGKMQFVHQQSDQPPRNIDQVLEGNPIAMFVIDANSRITHWNRGCELLTNFQASDMIGTENHRKAFYQEYRELMADLIVRNAADGEFVLLYGGKYCNSRLITEGYQGEDFFPNLGGSGKWLFFSCAPLKDVAGKVMGAITTIQDISDHKAMTQELRNSKAELDEKRLYLEKVNQALTSSLDILEVEKRAVEENLLVNLKRFVFPYLDELERCKIGADGKAYVNIIRTHINDIISQFSTTIFSKYIDFTPAEIRVADFIRNGKDTKEIAGLLGLSPTSIKWHRKNIREKLGLTHKKVNLHTYLNALDR